MYYPKVRKAIHTLVQGTIHRLQMQGFDAAKHYLHGSLANEHMTAVIEDLYTTVGKRHAQITYSRLLNERTRRKWVGLQLESKGFGFNAKWVQFILDYLKRFLLEKITIEINNTTRDHLLIVLTTAMNQGLSIDQTVDALKDWPYERYQAARIVRTEVNRAANVGNKAQAETDEYQQVKEWLSAQDFRVRGNNPKDHASHVALNGTVIDEGDEFVDSRNGDRLMFPGDPKGSAASTINCRCMAAYTYKRDINGNLIPKRKSTTVIFPGQIRRPETFVI